MSSAFASWRIRENACLCVLQTLRSDARDKYGFDRELCGVTRPVLDK